VLEICLANARLEIIQAVSNKQTEKQCGKCRAKADFMGEKRGRERDRDGRGVGLTRLAEFAYFVANCSTAC